MVDNCLMSRRVVRFWAKVAAGIGGDFIIKVVSWRVRDVLYFDGCQSRHFIDDRDGDGDGESSATEHHASLLLSSWLPRPMSD